METKKKARVVIIPEFDPQWSILEFATKCPPTGWENVFADARKELEYCSNYLQGYDFFPRLEELFHAFELTSLPCVKVVIFGQDPYPSITRENLPQATGLAFSSRKGELIPISLQNIFKELQNTVPSFNYPKHGDLTRWARQGVLLLNTCLTVQPKKSGSHGDLWLGFIYYVLRALNQNPNMIYVLWGSQAEKLTPYLNQKALILKAPHPVARNNSFFGNNHFNQINEHLISLGQEPIDWNVD